MNAPTPVKRNRRTNDQIAELEERLIEIVTADPPMTIRQLFYLAVNEKLVEKTENRQGSSGVYLAMKNARREGRLAWDAIEDHTRGVQMRLQWDSVGDRLKSLGDYYRRDFWQGRKDRPAIFVEKDGLAASMFTVTSEYGVPLMPGRGDSSCSFIYQSSGYLTDDSTVYAFTDLDAKGEGSIFTEIETKLRKDFKCHAEVKRIALTEDQVNQYNLPTRPPKKSDNRPWAVELDALPKAVLQQLVRDCILNHVDADEWQDHLEKEEIERERLTQIAKRESRRK
jgi:hypothetical protein